MTLADVYLDSQIESASIAAQFISGNPIWKDELIGYITAVVSILESRRSIHRFVDKFFMSVWSVMFKSHFL